MDAVILYDANCHEIQNYVAGVQWPFGIVTLAEKKEARKWTLEGAIEAMELVERTSNGHRALRMEFV